MKIKASLFLFFVILISCEKETHQAGICLSFDDRSVKEWFSIRDIFKEYNVHVTFFVSQFDSLSTEEMTMLHTLENDGHEIGSHGAHHIQAESYIKAHSYKEYFNYEIEPSITSLKKSGFNPVSFAYPYGSKYWFTDYLLLKRFKCTRGVASFHKAKDLSSIDEIYFDFDGSRKLSAFEIDKKLQLTHEMVLSGLDRAKEKNEVILLMAHVPAQASNNDYSFDIELLKFILNEAKKRNLKSYRFEDLVN